MMFLRWKIISLILSFLFLSCISRNYNTVELKDYLKETFQHSISANEIYIILPLDTCKSCLNKTKSFLLEQSVNQNIYVVLISKTNREAVLYADGLHEKYTVLTDTKEGIYNHTELAKNLPVIIYQNNNKPKVVPFNINTNFDEMKQMVLSFYKE